MFPENIVQATFQQVQTHYVSVKQRSVVFSPLNETFLNGTIGNTTHLIGSHLKLINTSTVLKPTLIYTNEVNVLGNVIIF